MKPLGLLLRNEIKVRWRELTGETKPATLVLSGVLILVVIHFFLWYLTRGLQGVLTSPLPPEAALIAAALLIVMFPFGVSAGINHSVVALFDRGDLDLLVSSPVGSRTVFASRVVAVAAGVFVTLGLFMFPIASTGVLIGVPQLLGAIPTLVSLSVVSASVGMLITLFLVRLLGARRARTVSQVVAALTGLLLVLASQLPNLLGGGDQLAQWLFPLFEYFNSSRFFAVDSLFWLPFRSMFLHPLGTLVSLTLTGLIFWATVTLLHRAFAYGVGLTDTAPKRARRSGGTVRFRSSTPLRVMVRKEWKLIRRDPFLISQVLLQAAYFLPAVYVLLFSDSTGIRGLNFSPALAATITVLAGITTSGLARIAVVGEEAGDLLEAAPVTGQQVERAKMIAVLAPVWTVVVPLSLWQLVVSPLAGATMLVLALLTTFMVVRMRLWNPTTASRKDLFKRNSYGDPIAAFLELAVPLVMSVASYLVATASPWALIPLAVAGVCVAVAQARAY